MFIKSLLTKYKNYRELQKIRLDWLTVLVNKGVTIGAEEDGTAETFDLLEMKRTEGVIKAISLVPYGLSISDLLEQKNRLEDALNCYISIDKPKFTPKIYIELITKQPTFKYKPEKTKEGQLFIAYNMLGKPVYADLNINNMFLIAGLRGMGKTVYIIITIVNCMLNNPDIDFHFIQIAKSELSIFNACKQTKSIVTNIPDTLVLFRWAIKEINRRADLFKRAGKGIDNIKKYNKKYPDKKLNRIFLVVEEMSFYMDAKNNSNKSSSEKKEIEEVWSLLVGICKAGRSVGIGFIGVVQRTTKENLDSNLKSQLSRITFRQESNVDSINVIDTKEATQLNPRELICTVGGRQKLIVPTIDEEYKDLIRYLPELGAEPTKEQLKQQKDFISSLKPTEKLIKAIKTGDIQEEDKTHTKEVKALRNDFKQSEEVTEVKEEVRQVNYTKRDRKLIKLLEQYGALTVNQCAAMFFRDNKTKDTCRRRLNELVSKNILDSSNVGNKRIKQYYLKEQKPKTEHDLYIIDCYTKFLELGCDIKEFKLTPKLLGGKVVPDAFIKLIYKHKTFNIFIEVDLTHLTEQPKINLYEEFKIKNNLDFSILILKLGKLKIESNKIEIYQSDFKLSNLSNFLEKS